MSWFQRLYETYENCVALSEEEGSEIIPICHTVRKAQIEVVINNSGEFLEAKFFEQGKSTVIPSTEDSASRSSNCAPHGLADKIQYCAKDYENYGGKKKSYFCRYYNQLCEWCNSEFSNDKVVAVREYLGKGRLIEDLIESGILGVENELLVIKKKHKKIKYVKDILVRWRVQIPGDKRDKTWEDKEIRESWINFIKSTIQQDKGLCYVTGKENQTLLGKHSSSIRYDGDKAKLISSNDSDGFTFRGRFENVEQALGISLEVSQKAHNALKWLLSSERRQAYINAGQEFVAWSLHGNKIPKPFDDSYELFEVDNLYELFEDNPCSFDEGKDLSSLGTVFAEKLVKIMKGYTLELESDKTDSMVILGIDSATEGRLSVIYYKELKGSVFLERLESWHKKYSWLQYYGKNKEFYGAPSPKDVAEIAYGKTLDDKLKKIVIKRILPCILENKRIPDDLVSNCVRRASNPIILENRERRKALGIACALYKGNCKEDYKVALDTKNANRDYLYGRLLGVIDYAERSVLEIDDKQRPTNAQKYMNLFSTKPYSTWIKLHDMFNVGYMHKLLNSGKFYKVNSILQEINTKFVLEEYKDDSKLEGEFLLGYFCQLADLYSKKKSEQE